MSEAGRAEGVRGRQREHLPCLSGVCRASAMSEPFKTREKIARPSPRPGDPSDLAAVLLGTAAGLMAADGRYHVTMDAHGKELVKTEPPELLSYIHTISYIVSIQSPQL